MTPLEFLQQYHGEEVALPEECLRELEAPSFRAQVLDAIHRRPEVEASGLLRVLLDVEVDYWRRVDQAGAYTDENSEFFENIYWCAFLLWRTGDVRDVLALWRAKHTTFDTFCGLDAQYLVGAGVEETIAYLRESSEAEAKPALKYLLEGRKSGAFDLLEKWAQHKSTYFGGAAE